MNWDHQIAIYQSLHRIFTGQLQELYDIIENISDIPLYGRTLQPFILNIINIEFYDLDKKMKIYIYNINPSNPIIGKDNKIYYGKAYTNFGLLLCI